MKRFLLLFLLLLGTPAQAGVTCTLPFNLQNGTTADASQVMANYNALVTCLGNAAAAGANSDITALLGLLTPIPYTAGGTSMYIGGTSTGSSNAQVVATPTPSGYSLATHKRIIFTAGFTNLASVSGGATTLNVNGQGVTNVFRMTPSGPQALTGGEIVAGNTTVADYDGTQYELLTTQAQFGGFGPTTALASGTTTDLGTIPSHNVSVSGTTTITSFGASASTTYPIYRVNFQAALTLTYNQTNCATTGGCINLPGAANITTAANDSAFLLYLGAGSGGGGNWHLFNYQRANGTAVVNPTPNCGFNGLTLANNAGTPNTNVDYAADSAVLINASGNVPIYGTAISGTINTTNGTVTSAVDGMDGEARGNNNMVTLWFISDGTNFKGLGSLSTTAPTLPAGYIYKCYAGTMKTNGSANFYGSQQKGNTVQYTVGGANLTALPNQVNGTASSTNCTTSTPGWISTTIRGTTGTGVWVPSTAERADIVIMSAYNGNGPATILVAPNTSYGGAGAVNPPSFSLNGATGVSAWGMQLEGNTVAYCSNTAGGAIFVSGWRDKVNAN